MDPEDRVICEGERGCMSSNFESPDMALSLSRVSFNSSSAISKIE